MKNESVLDHPQADLDPVVWTKVDGLYTLTEDAERKIESVVKWVIENAGILGFSLHIAGSITSN
jgi:hypothetical protein